MLRELDFIESDWAALLWALGSTTAIFKHSIPRGLRTWVGNRFGGEGRPMLRNIEKKAVGLMSGVVIAVAVLAVCAFGLERLSFLFFPAWHVERVPWAEWLSVIVIPETIFTVTAVTLWRKKKSVAAGILLSAIALFTHFVIHVATHA